MGVVCVLAYANTHRMVKALFFRSALAGVQFLVVRGPGDSFHRTLRPSRAYDQGNLII